jgi:hypothetical protein
MVITSTIGAEDRRVPADNDLAEQDLPPTAIARKVRFDLHSEEHDAIAPERLCALQ